MKLRSSVVASILLFSTPVFAAENTANCSDFKSTKEVWNISQCYRDDNTFSHCSLITTYQPRKAHSRRLMRANSMALLIKIFQNQTFSVGVASIDWKSNEGNRQDLVFTFEDGNWHKFPSIWSNDGYLYWEGDLSKEFIGNFMASNHVNISINNKNIGGFYLSESRIGFNYLMQCFANNVDTTNQTGGPTFGDDDGPTFE